MNTGASGSTLPPNEKRNDLYDPSNDPHTNGTVMSVERGTEETRTPKPEVVRVLGKEGERTLEHRTSTRRRS